MHHIKLLKSYFIRLTYNSEEICSRDNISCVTQSVSHGCLIQVAKHNKCVLKQDMLVDTDLCDSKAGSRQLETCPPDAPTVGDKALQSGLWLCSYL